MVESINCSIRHSQATQERTRLLGAKSHACMAVWRMAAHGHGRHIAHGGSHIMDDGCASCKQ
eukprot:scaffold47726_cov258-Isochrysis_galbana.AAC.3